MTDPVPQYGIFRQRALEHQTEQEAIDALLRITAPHEWIIAAGLATLLVACLAWGVLGRIELTLQVDGMLAKAGERGVIVSTVAGRVLDLPVKPGEAVPADAVIASMEPAALEMRARLAAAREAALASAARQHGENDPTLQAALQAARVERLELDAFGKWGSQVVSARQAEISALLVGVGETVEAGTPLAQVRFAGPGPPEAVVFLDLQQAQDLQPGMTASIHYQPTESEAVGVLQGKLRTVSAPRLLPAWLTVALVGATVSDERLGRLARFSIVGPIPSQFSDLTPARLEISLGRLSPLELLGSQ